MYACVYFIRMHVRKYMYACVCMCVCLASVLAGCLAGWDGAAFRLGTYRLILLPLRLWFCFCYRVQCVCMCCICAGWLAGWLSDRTGIALYSSLQVVFDMCACMYFSWD